jgi:hypothetical protein
MADLPSLAELSAKVNDLARALPIAQSRVNLLEMAKVELESKNQTLTTLHASFSTRVTELSGQLSAALNIVQTIQNERQISPSVSFPSSDPTQTSSWKQELELQLETMEAEEGFLKMQADANGSISSFLTLIPSFQSVKDVKAWIKKGFAKGGGDGQPYHDNRSSGEYLSDDDIPTFCQFANFFVVMCTCEDLESRATKGESLKEMEAIEKAGLNHQGESTVVYALKHPIPGFLGKSVSANRKVTSLLAVKTVSDWDMIFKKEMARGLKNI